MTSKKAATGAVNIVDPALIFQGLYIVGRALGSGVENYVKL